MPTQHLFFPPPSLWQTPIFVEVFSYILENSPLLGSRAESNHGDSTPLTICCFRHEHGSLFWQMGGKGNWSRGVHAYAFSPIKDRLWRNHPLLHWKPYLHTLPRTSEVTLYPWENHPHTWGQITENMESTWKMSLKKRNYPQLLPTNTAKFGKGISKPSDNTKGYLLPI
jgi:hypothetical protein